MSRCILHVGMHKTGSTSIQSSLDGYADDRFCYAALDTSNHSLAMFSLFAADPGRHRLHQSARRGGEALADYVADMRARLEHSVAKAGQRTLIVSGEDLSVMPPGALARLRDWFAARFAEIAVVGYVRPPAGFISSGFQQRVKDGNVRQGLSLERGYREYRRRFDAIDDVFGRSNVQLWKYDPAAFPDGCVVRDFCSRLGIDLPARRIVRLNESLPRPVVGLLYAYHRLGRSLGYAPMTPREGDQLARLLAAGGGERFRFSPDAVRPVLETHRQDIEWMEARLGQSLDENLGEHRPGDVRDESDLLSFDGSTAARLLGLLGKAAPAGVTGAGGPEDIVRLLHALREQLVPAAARGALKLRDTQASNAAPAKPMETVDTPALVDAARRENPGAFEGIPSEQAVPLVQTVLEQINRTLATSREGTVITYSGLGRFAVGKPVARPGTDNAPPRRVIRFRANATARKPAN